VLAGFDLVGVADFEDDTAGGRGAEGLGVAGAAGDFDGLGAALLER
jgi:hypothetical protein